MTRATNPPRSKPNMPKKPSKAARIAKIAAQIAELKAEEDAINLEMGRPAAYRSEFAHRATGLCLLGLTNVELAERFNTSEESIYQWIRDVPEFSKAIYEGREGADIEIANALHKSARGYEHPEDDIRTVALGNNQGSQIEITRTVKRYPPNPASITHWMHSRQRDRFPTPQSQVNGGVATPDAIQAARAAMRAALATFDPTTDEGDAP